MATSSRKTKAGKKKRASQTTVNGPAKPADRASTATEKPPVPSPLRGILPTPREVAKFVARVERQRPMSDKARYEGTERIKMQYYFGGWDVAYRDTGQGWEVLAVGLREIRNLRNTLSPAQWQDVHIGNYEPW
jgi:hypothetical protein